MMRVAVVDYGSGNLHSVLQSLKAAASREDLPYDCFLTNQAEEVAQADYIVLPGVGAYKDCAENLAAVDGMMDALTETVVNKSRPFLGICVGMQLMAQRGMEDGITDGLGWFQGDVDRLQPELSNGQALKIPHMGWNSLDLLQPHDVFNGVDMGDAVYFVHSYHLSNPQDEDLIAVVDYGGRVVAAIGRDNMVGMQFHPEKSQQIGQKLLLNFLNWKP